MIRSLSYAVAVMSLGFSACNGGGSATVAVSATPLGTAPTTSAGASGGTATTTGTVTTTGSGGTNTGAEPIPEPTAVTPEPVITPMPIATVTGTPVYPSTPVSPPVVIINPVPVGGPGGHICPETGNGCGPDPIRPLLPIVENGGGSISNSVASDVKDVDLQKAAVQEQDLESRVNVVANQFQMSMDSARQVTVLSDRLRALSSGGQSMTLEDRQAITASALELTGVSMDDIGDALSKSAKGDQAAVDDLFTKAAANLGMPSSKQLRDQLLPALGVNLN